MTEVFNPKPTRLLLPTADEFPSTLNHFRPYPLPEDSARLAEIRDSTGLRVASDEATALFVAREALTMTSTPEEAAELGTFFSVIAYGGCKYLLADGEAVEGEQGVQPKRRQNRYGHVPMLAALDPAQRPNTEQLRDEAVASIDDAIQIILTRTASLKHRLPLNKQRFIDVFAGRELMRAASQLAVIGTGDVTADPGNYIGDDEAQLMSRDACMRTLNVRDDLGIETGTHISLIQGASPISPAAVELQRAGSPAASKIFMQAYSLRGDQTARSFSTKNGWFLT